MIALLIVLAIAGWLFLGLYPCWKMCKRQGYIDLAAIFFIIIMAIAGPISFFTAARAGVIDIDFRINLKK